MSGIINVVYTCLWRLCRCRPGRYPLNACLTGFVLCQCTRSLVWSHCLQVRCCAVCLQLYLYPPRRSPHCPPYSPAAARAAVAIRCARVSDIVIIMLHWVPIAGMLRCYCRYMRNKIVQYSCCVFCRLRAAPSIPSSTESTLSPSQPSTSSSDALSSSSGASASAPAAPAMSPADVLQSSIDQAAEKIAGQSVAQV